MAYSKHRLLAIYATSVRTEETALLYRPSLCGRSIPNRRTEWVTAVVDAAIHYNSIVVYVLCQWLAIHLANLLSLSVSYLRLLRMYLLSLGDLWLQLREVKVFQFGTNLLFIHCWFRFHLPKQSISLIIFLRSKVLDRSLWPTATPILITLDGRRWMPSCVLGKIHETFRHPNPLWALPWCLSHRLLHWTWLRVQLCFIVIVPSGFCRRMFITRIAGLVRVKLLKDIWVSGRLEFLLFLSYIGLCKVWLLYRMIVLSLMSLLRYCWLLLFILHLLQLLSLWLYHLSENLIVTLGFMFWLFPFLVLRDLNLDKVFQVFYFL